MSIRDQIRKGSTEILILRLLEDEPMYGYQIVQELKERSGGYFDTKEGLLYPTLHRMKQAGLVTSEWEKTKSQRRRKYYHLTADGRKMLDEGSAEWEAFMQQMRQMLTAGQAPATS